MVTNIKRNVDTRRWMINNAMINLGNYENLMINKYYHFQFEPINKIHDFKLINIYITNLLYEFNNSSK